MADNMRGDGHPAERLSAVADTFAKTGMRSGEMGIAAAQTIGYRTAMMAAAMGTPTGFANPEFLRMGSEKIEASVEAFQAVAHGLGEFGAAWMTMLTKQTQAAALVFNGLTRCQSPTDLAEIQRKAFAQVVDASVNASLRFAEAAASITAASVKPAYRKVRANARRLAAEQAA
jgi:hypothetical protein